MKKKNCLLLSGMLILLLGCLTGCMNTFDYTYSNAEKYTAGDRTISEKIDTIDTDYVSGDIQMTAATGSEISMTETANKELDDAHKVHTWVDGTTLYIRYCESSTIMNFSDIEKHLDIKVPSGTTFKTIKTDISSGSFTCRDLKTDALDVDASSGSIDVECTSADINMDVSSGSINLKQHGKSNSIALEESSGNINASIEDATSVSLGASSGDTVFSARNVEDIKYEASSGAGNFTFDTAPKTSDFDASSGDISIFIPENSSLTATIDTASGDFNYDLPFEKNEETYKIGAGTGKMSIDTSSGDVKINKK
ncbi:MAG: DUF4097 domain-containing protein [Eubacterium sp.]|nr:DUF4097 domain-containing protein [Eubacterium sp.]